jgi:hypothetical protein
MSSSRSLSVRTGAFAFGTGASRARAALLLLLALAGGGCSATMPAPTGGVFGSLQTAMGDPGPKPAAPVDVEADGHEAQRPPLLRMYRRDDDPMQPFSPNYGEVPMPQEPDADTDKAPT